MGHSAMPQISGEARVTAHLDLSKRADWMFAAGGTIQHWSHSPTRNAAQHRQVLKSICAGQAASRRESAGQADPVIRCRNAARTQVPAVGLGLSGCGREAPLASSPLRPHRPCRALRRRPPTRAPQAEDDPQISQVSRFSWGGQGVADEGRGLMVGVVVNAAAICSWARAATATYRSGTGWRWRSGRAARTGDGLRRAAVRVGRRSGYAEGTERHRMVSLDRATSAPAGGSPSRRWVSVSSQARRDRGQDGRRM